MTPCPWPSKRRYPNLRTAHRVLKALGQRAEDLAPYRCGDHYHVGRQVRQTARQIIRQAKTRAKREP